MLNPIEFVKMKMKFLLKTTPKDKIEIYIAKYLDSSKSITIVDVGAHRGDFIDLVEKHYKIQKAVLVEPIPDLANYLKSRFDKRYFFIFQNLLADVDCKFFEFQVNEYAETSSILAFKTEMNELANVNTKLLRKVDIMARTLDSIINETKILAIDFLKIDVQGAESLVLKGGTKTLACTKFIWVELSFKPLYTGSSVFHDIYSLMEDAGFLLLELSPGHRSAANELLQADALFMNRNLQ